MSSTSDRARFYLEQGVPQLQEFEQKKIFTKDEIRTLVKKRSDFEHRVLSRGSSPVDFARYAAWEISLEALRLKRCRRLHIKTVSVHTSQSRIFQIFDRGTRKHPGDLQLWTSYLEYCRSAKATKKFKTVLTSAIRLHPTKSELWLYAAKWTLELEADMNEARSYMQRGTRFCIRDPDLWVEYAKLEMIYLAKIFMRRKILGLDPDLLSPGTLKGDDLEMAERELEEEEDLGFSTAQDIIRLPDFPATALRANTLKTISVDTEARKDPINTPALNGAIPLAIFDAAKSQPFFCPAAAEQFFDMFSLFIHVPCMPRILSHVVETMKELWKDDAKTANCWIREPWIWTEILDPEFPMRLGEGLKRLKGELGRLKEGNRQMGREREELVKMSRVWIERVLGAEGLDAGIETVLRFTLRKLE